MFMDENSWCLGLLQNNPVGRVGTNKVHWVGNCGIQVRAHGVYYTILSTFVWKFS